MTVRKEKGASNVVCCAFCLLHTESLPDILHRVLFEIADPNGDERREERVLTIVCSNAYSVKCFIQSFHNAYNK